MAKRKATLGEKIRAERLRREMSQAEAAKALGDVDRVSLARWESDARLPSGRAARAAIEAFIGEKLPPKPRRTSRRKRKKK